MMIKFYTIATNSFLDAKTSVSAQLRKLAAEESGATAIEYSLIAAGIADAIMAIVLPLGSHIAARCVSISCPTLFWSRRTWPRRRCWPVLR